MKLPVYYCNIDNFGDKLNEEIFKLFFNKNIKFENIDKAIIVGIGSLLDSILYDKNDTQYINKPIYIFSSGFGFEEGGFFHNPNIILPEKFKIEVVPIALRGKLTKMRVEKIMNKKLNCILGDAGLLSNLLIDKNNVAKKYSVGIVPHFADFNDDIWNDINSFIPNSIILDAKKTPKEFLRDLCECESVISSAMHPLIACDALGIPNLWVRISEETTSRYKFADYYSIYNLENIKPFDLKSDFSKINKNFIKSNYRIDNNIVKSTQKELISSIKNFKNKILCRVLLYYLQKNLKIFLQNIFSVKNSYDKKRKVIKILGLKITI